MDTVTCTKCGMLVPDPTEEQAEQKLCPGCADPQPAPEEIS